MDQPTATSTATDIAEFLGAQPPPAWHRRAKWGAIAIGVLLLLVLAWRLTGGGAEQPSYATAPVERGDLSVTISATGNLQPTNQVDVGSELSGLVERVFVDNNDRVAKGQILARLDTSRFQDSVNQSRAALEAALAGVGTARATAAQARASLARFEEVYRLSGGKVPSATELDSARAEHARGIAGVASAQAAVAQARAQLSSNMTQLAKASIFSPVNGVVLSRKIEPGQTVAASFNAPVLFQIAEDLSQMRLEVKVDEADVGQVAKGQRARFTVDAFPGRQFPALIERVDVGANASSSTTTTATASSVVSYTARLAVANSDLILRPGMTATADIIAAERRNVLLIPNAALRFKPDRAGRGAKGVTSLLMPPRRGGGGGARKTGAIGRGSHQAIYVLDEKGKATPVTVVIGATNGNQTEISGGDLKPGAQVIIGRKASAADGG